jgi:hypothetical protein
MPVGDIFKVATVAVLHGHEMVNTFHYRILADGAGPDNAATVASLFQVNVLPAIVAAQSNQVQYVRLEVQRQLPLPISIRLDRTLAQTGGASTPSVPDAVALVIRRRSLYAGRGYRGRIFVGGIAQQYYNPATGRFFTDPSTPFGPLTTAIATGLYGAGTPLTAEPVLYRRARNGTLKHPLPVASQILVINTSAMDDIPRSQRRRQLDRGR